MPSRKFPRIEIDQRAYDALLVESVKRHRTIRDVATEAILGHVSKEAIQFIDQKTTGPQTQKVKDITTGRPEDQKTIEMECHTVGDIEKCEEMKPKKRKRLINDQPAISRIKELWSSGERNRAEIARQIGHKERTVAAWIDRALKTGELQE